MHPLEAKKAPAIKSVNGSDTHGKYVKLCYAMTFLFRFAVYVPRLHTFYILIITNNCFQHITIGQSQMQKTENTDMLHYY